MTVENKNVHQESVKRKGPKLWTVTSSVSGGVELLKANDYTTTFKDRYEHENLNE
jgi:hypothetical protein